MYEQVTTLAVECPYEYIPCTGMQKLTLILSQKVRVLLDDYCTVLVVQYSTV